jgi:RNA polymerase sigma factor (sigma-70 family)
MSDLSNYIHRGILDRAIKPRQAIMDKLDGNTLIRSLQEGDSGVLDQLYDRYRGEFITWCSRHFKGLDREDFIDAWQETVIAFYDQVISFRLTVLTCEVKTYLFIIGRRYVIKQMEKAKRTVHVDPLEETFSLVADTVTFDWEDPDSEKKEMVGRAMKQLSEQCKSALMMRFAEGLSVPEIMQKSGYPNLNTVSATLSRCLRKLKEMIQDTLQSGYHE